MNARFAKLCAGLLWATGNAAAAIEPNPYEPQTADAVDRLDRDAMFGRPGADSAILSWLERNSDAPLARRRQLYHRLCEIFGVRTWHAQRALACAEERELSDSPGGGDDDAGMSDALATTLPIRARGSAAIPLQANVLGSRSGAIAVSGVTLDWIIDTGAEISVLPRSHAERLGVRYLRDAVRVGTTTADVNGAVAVIDVMRVGSAVVENVPVLVLADDRLTLAARPGEAGTLIPGILGLPVLAAFGRMAWLDGGAMLLLGEASPRPPAAAEPIYWHEDGLGVPIGTDLGLMGAHFDSGANSTYLFGLGQSLVSPELRGTALLKTVQTSGAGGVVEERLHELPRLALRFGQADIDLANVTLHPDRDRVARVGNDALSRLQLLIFDFEEMTMFALARPGPATE